MSVDAFITRLFEWTEWNHLHFNGCKILKTNEISLNKEYCYYNIEKKSTTNLSRKF